MDITAAFPSKFIKASDLQGKTVKLKMIRIEVEKLGDDLRPVIYFHGTDKGLVANKTNANRITAAYGRETDDWIGKDIELYPEQVEYQGRLTPAIRVREPAKAPQGKSAPVMTGHLNAPPPASPDVYGAGSLAEDLDDSIPFSPEWR